MSDIQTKGRGRSGRKWESPKGGLWFSIVLRPNIPVNEVPLLQLMFANALRRAIGEFSMIRPSVKWPNDIVVGSKKLAGILIETSIARSILEYVVVGVGLNTNLASRQIPAEATSILVATKQETDHLIALDSILTTFKDHYAHRGERSSIINDWWDHCAHRLRAVNIHTPSGLIHGTSTGITDDGGLVVKTENGTLTISEGTLRF